MRTDLLALQNSLISISPGLLPLGCIAFSLLNSWHCSLMCGPLVQNTTKRAANQFLLLRVVSYAAIGAALGFFGKSLRDSLEYELIGALSFFILAIISLVCIFPYFVKRLRFLLPNLQWSAARGILWGFVPCHLLFFLYGIAVLSGSVWAGAGLLFVHAIMTTPALVYSNRFFAKLRLKTGYLAHTLKFAILALVVFNLLYFWGVLINGSEGAHSKLMFCF